MRRNRNPYNPDPRPNDKYTQTATALNRKYKIGPKFDSFSVIFATNNPPPVPPASMQRNGYLSDVSSHIPDLAGNNPETQYLYDDGVDLAELLALNTRHFKELVTSYKTERKRLAYCVSPESPCKRSILPMFRLTAQEESDYKTYSKAQNNYLKRQCQNCAAGACLCVFLGAPVLFMSDLFSRIMTAPPNYSDDDCCRCPREFFCWPPGSPGCR